VSYEKPRLATGGEGGQKMPKTGLCSLWTLPYDLKNKAGSNSFKSLGCPMTCNQAIMRLFKMKLVG